MSIGKIPQRAACTADSVQSHAPNSSFALVALEAGRRRVTVKVRAVDGSTRTLSQSELTRIAVSRTDCEQAQRDLSVNVAVLFDSIAAAMQANRREIRVGFGPEPGLAPAPKTVSERVTSPQVALRPQSRPTIVGAAQRFRVRAIEKLGRHVVFTAVSGSLRNYILESIEDDAQAQLFLDFLDKAPVAASASREAMLWQLAHYRTPAVAEALAGMAGSYWDQTPNQPEDRHRGAKLVAYLAHVIDSTDHDLQRPLLGRSLNSILGPGERFSLAFEDLGVQPDGDEVKGKASGDRVTLDRARISGDSEALVCPDAASTEAMSGDEMIGRSMALSTFVHEVDHLSHGDRVAETFRYLMGEYGAWYAGTAAQSGVRPTRQAAYSRLRYLLTDEDGPYANLRRARLKADQYGQPGPEARRIIEFMNQFFETPLALDQLSSTEAIVSAAHVVPRPADPAPEIHR